MPVSLELKRKLDAMFLPEVHRTRWGRCWTDLENAKEEATTAADGAVIEAQIREHMKREYDTEGTRLELEAEYKRMETSSEVDGRRCGR